MCKDIPLYKNVSIIYKLHSLHFQLAQKPANCVDKTQRRKRGGWRGGRACLLEWPDGVLQTKSFPSCLPSFPWSVGTSYFPFSQTHWGYLAFFGGVFGRFPPSHGEYHFWYLPTKELQEKLTNLSSSSNPDHSKQFSCSEDVRRPSCLVFTHQIPRKSAAP